MRTKREILQAKWEELWGFLARLPAARCLHAALFVWVIYSGVVAAIVAVDPDGRSATLEYQARHG